MKKPLAIYFSVYGTANTTAEEASLHPIALAVFVTNLFMKKKHQKSNRTLFFCAFFLGWSIATE